MANTLEIQMQLNKLLEEASEKIEKMNGQYSKQTKMLEYMTEAIKKMNELISKSSGVGSKLASGFESASESAKEAGSDMDSALQKASDKINSTTDSAKKLGGGFGDISKEMTKLNAGISIVGGIGKAISFVANSALAALQTIQGIGSGIFEIGKSVLAFPFKLLDGLISMASVSGSNELAQELEEIRKQFGYLNKTAGGTIIELAKNMKGELANTGISVWRTFGNLVERLRYFREYAQKLGETIDAVFRDLSVSQAEALGAFNKGLGFTDEGLKGVAQRSLATGENLNEINRQIGNYSIQLSKAFGVSMKLVSRDVGNMIADFEHFGHMAVKEMTQASVFVRRLGIDVKALGKLVDKYMNFEDAANSAAQLSQAFGLNVDAFKLMQEQDPAKKLEMLRKGFFATGRTIENMTAQERRLLAQQTGLGESEIALAFAQKNRALSYADIQKKGDAAKKSQLSQEQVLNKLAGAIERLVKSGSAMQGGFFDRFIQGFVSGIRYSKEFRELMRNLQRSLMMVFYAGRQVGLAFAQLFPGIKEFFGGLRDMFNPRVMKTFLNKVVGAFKDFFKQMTENPATALPKLLDKLQDAFSDRFSAAGSGARKVFDGIKKFFKAVGYIFLSGIKEALLGLGKIVAPLISSIFSDETFSKAGNQISGSVDGIGGTLSKMFRDVFGEEGSPARQKISEALSKFADSIWVAAKFFIGKIAEKLPELFEAIANGLAIGESTVTKSGTGDKFASGLAKSFEKMKPHLIKIAESLGTIILTGLGSALTSPSLWKTIGLQALSMITNMLVVLPAWLGGFVTELFQDLFAGIGRLSTELGDYISEKIGNNIVGKTVKAIWRLIGFVSNVVAIGFKAISRSLYTVGAFFSDVFESPTKAIENLKRRFTGLVGELGNDLKRSFNTLLAGIPDQVKSILGLTPFVIPTPPPAQNPAVQSMRQAEEQSRTSSRNINENLTNALEITPPSQATRSVQDSSLSERVSSIRDSIQSATEAGRIDQNKATAAFQKLQEFATNLGPVLQTTQTALNKSLAGIDTDKLTSNVESIKSIIENVNSIRNLTARQLQPISISSLIPLENSIDAISTFASSPMLVRLEQALTTAETSTRITGIQNTSNAIKDMVETINQTSRELARLNPINIQTNLNRLASNLGLGNNSVYTIRNENFTVQVNNHVYLDVKELEKVLVERPDTRIRHT
jgi:methyl-accepting chemotaxis protein